jgi:hypothetical protein
VTDKAKGCVQSAKGPLVPPAGTARTNSSPEPEVDIMSVRVGIEAPDFEATAYVDGDFTNLKLSDYRGKWVTLCFYPGDFTFV